MVQRSVRAAVLAGVLVWVLCSAPAFAQGPGSICLQSGSFDAFAKGAATVEAYAAQQSQTQAAPAKESVRYVQVDKLPPVKVTSLVSGTIGGLTTAGRHVLRISAQPDMKPRLEAFYFSFQAQKSDTLCLWYKSYYASWVLQPLKGSGCRCA